MAAGVPKIDDCDVEGNARRPHPIENARLKLEGNPTKGLSASTGAGDGDWRLALDGTLDAEVLSYIRTKDGFLTAMHDLAPRTAS